MAIAFSMSTKGSAELVAALKNLPKAVAGKATRSALRDATKVLHRETVARAPVKSGAMRAALTVRAAKRSRKGFGYKVIFHKGKAQKLRKVSKKDNTAWFYPAVVEYGDHDTPAHPFMRPAFEAKKGEALDVFAARLRALIKEAAKAK